MLQYESIGVTSWGANRLDIFAVGTDGAMYHKDWDGTQWQPVYPVWENLGGDFLSAPWAVSWGTNRLDVFAIGTDQGMYHKAWTGTAWLPPNPNWERVGSKLDRFASPPAVASWGANRLDIF